MFAVPVSLKKTKKIGLAVAATVLAVICVVATVRILDRPRDTATSAAGKQYALAVERDGYAAFFRQIGIAAAEKPLMEKTVRIPDVFDAVYAAYNDLQKQAGLDLAPYRGLQARLLTFRTDAPVNGFATLLVKDGRVIGGHLSDGEYGSRQYPLTE